MIEIGLVEVGADRALLKERAGDRVLTIQMSPELATAIDMGHRGVVTPRPWTHDFVRDLIEGLGVALDRVVVTDNRQGTFYAEAVFVQPDRDPLVVSCRPSDGIALAVRTGAPLYATAACLAAATAPATPLPEKHPSPVNLDFNAGSRADGFPIGWRGGGEGYRIDVDTAVVRRSSPSARIAQVMPVAAATAGVLTQCIDPGAFRGHRVRYAGHVRTADVEGWAGLWMRVDGPADAILAFDNMEDRGLRGTLDWRECEIVLDVPDEAVGICFGALVADEGATAWVDGLTIDIVAPAGTGLATTGGWGGGPGPRNLDFEAGARRSDRPQHWSGGGRGYELAVDRTVVHDGAASGRVRSTSDPDRGAFGTMTQCFGPPASFVGRRVRYSGYLRTENVTGGAGLWMRVDGPDQGRPIGRFLAFDNMGDRPVTGSSEWQRYDIILPVHAEATGICFGFLLNGPGTVWGDDLAFEVLGPVDH